MADLPTGTVSFLFTDIEGSTRLWEQHPQAMAGALARHDAIMRQAITVEAGVAYKVIGDAFQAAFTTAPAACAAALAAQRALAGEAWGAVGAMPVRMALHTCAAVPEDGDYRTGALNRLGRLLGAVHGGQIVLSHATADLARDTLPLDVTLRDLGERQLRDLRPEPVFQLSAPDLPSDFPALKTLDRPRHNLPSQLNMLIGREYEVAAVRQRLLRDHVRLLTLTGPGGTGKTRLAMQATFELLDDFSDGVWFVNLAPISDSSLVAGTVAQTLGVRESSGRPLLDQLKDYLREKQLLLLLDNFEQIVDAALLIGELLAAAPGLKVLVTSREPLHLAGEHEYAVPPLALPPITDDHAADQRDVITQYESVRLFLERAQAVKADFAVTHENAPAITAICRRLDGLPLAIELAAARVKLLPPQALLARLDQRLQLLTGGARDAPARQQTIRNTIEWSYHLLDAGEQTLFARLGVFVGGCTLEAAEAVCAQGKRQKVKGKKGDDAAPVLPFTFSLLALLAALVDKSLLKQAEGAAGEPRFTMLETIREYAVERLAASGETEALRRRHADYFLARAEALEPEVWGAQQVRSLEQLQIGHDNLRAALRWLFDRGQMEMALRLAGAMWRFWLLRGHFSEGSRWLEHVLAINQGATVAARVKVCTGAGWMAWHRGDWVRAAVFHEQALTLARELGDKQSMATALTNLGIQHYQQSDYEPASARLKESVTLAREVGDTHMMAWALNCLGLVAMHQGDYTTGRAILEESLVLWREVGDKWGIALTLMGLGGIALRQGDYVQATGHYEESLALRREVGDKHRIASSLLDLGDVALAQGDYAAARALYEEGLALEREVGSTWGVASALAGLGHVALDDGDHTAANALYRESLALHQELSDKRGMIECLEGLASVASARPTAHPAELTQPERAARLFGAAEALREIIGQPLPPVQRTRYEHKVNAARSQMDKVAFAAAWAAGRAMTLEGAIAEALRVPVEARPAPTGVGTADLVP